MQKKKSATPRLAIISLATLTLCATAQAQDASSAWYISPTINRLSPDTDWNPDSKGTGYGLKFGRALADHWDLQLGLNSARSKDNGASYRQTLLGADVLYLFGSPGPGFRPFLSAGLGAGRDSISGPLNAKKTSPYVSAGLGARYQFNEKFALQADWKRVHSAMKDSTRTALGFVPGNNSNNSYLGLALNYTFGSTGSSAMKPAVMAPPPAPMEAAAVPPPAPAPMAAAAPAPAPETAPVKPAPRMEKVTMQGTELFAINKAELRAPQPKLDELADMLVKNPSITGVVVTGHTDRLGTDKINKALSQRRADAVKAYLVGKGVAANRIQAVGKGSSQPVKTCSVKTRAALVECLEPNRRVEVEPVTFERQVP